MKKSEAYNAAIEFAKQHYENFPVVSFLIKKKLRKDVAIIYWFARTADDFADEGNLTSEYRLELLDNFRNRLSGLISGNFENDFEEALYLTINNHNLDPDLFFDLLSAFRQDVIKTEYDDFDELLDYCRRSANPVGRLILQLYDIREDDVYELSDKICTALQLTNFWQDIETDFNKGRIYLPQNELKQFNVNRNIFEISENSLNFKSLLEHQVHRTRSFFNEGRSLLNHLSGRLKYEIRWTVLGGEEILNKIVMNDFSIFGNRPKLNKKDFLKLLIKSTLNV